MQSSGLSPKNEKVIFELQEWMRWSINGGMADVFEVMTRLNQIKQINLIFKCRAFIDIRIDSGANACLDYRSVEQAHWSHNFYLKTNQT